MLLSFHRVLKLGILPKLYTERQTVYNCISPWRHPIDVPRLPPSLVVTIPLLTALALEWSLAKHGCFFPASLNWHPLSNSSLPITQKSTPSASQHSWAHPSSHSTAHWTSFSTDKLLGESFAWDTLHSAPFRRLTSCLSFRFCPALASLRSIQSCLSGTTVQVTSRTTWQLSDYCVYLRHWSSVRSENESCLVSPFTHCSESSRNA